MKKMKKKDIKRLDQNKWRSGLLEWTILTYSIFLFLFLFFFLFFSPFYIISTVIGLDLV